MVHFLFFSFHIRFTASGSKQVPFLNDVSPSNVSRPTDSSLAQGLEPGNSEVGKGSDAPIPERIESPVRVIKEADKPPNEKRVSVDTVFQVPRKKVEMKFIRELTRHDRGAAWTNHLK